MAHSTGNSTRIASAMRGTEPTGAVASVGAWRATHHDGAEASPGVAIAELRPPGAIDRAYHTDVFSFGHTTVIPGRRELSCDGAKVDLGDRAFDLLLALVDARGSILSKDQLMERVWPGRIVEENTLEGQISILRRALGDDRSAIHTIAGRGYQFIGELSEARAATPAVPTAPAASLRGIEGLPASISRLIGRESALCDVSELARSHRLVTLVGTGGVGKTRLSIEAARLLAPHFSEGVYLAELAATASPDYLPTTVALALGLPPGEATSSLEGLAPHLQDRPVLLLLDNCEHLIESVARLAENFLRIAPLASIIATSREPLRVTGEYLYRVASLDVPADDSDANAHHFGAVQLFEERVGSEAVECIDRALALPLKARICRRLDGIPLAIELAAACVPAFGLQGVAERLDDRFQLLTRGARGALPRQQTLRATLDWSYGRLPEVQSTVLNRLSVFPGAFTLESAQMVANCERISPDTVVTALIELVNKSLVSAISSGGHVRYRLLETMRAYAHDRLRASGMLREIAKRHADHLALSRQGDQAGLGDRN